MAWEVRVEPDSWILFLVPAFPGSMTLGWLLSHFGSQLPHLYNGSSSRTHFMWL